MKVNGDIVTRGELEEQRREMEQMLRQERKLTGPQLVAAVEENSKDLLRDKIDELLLVQKAKDMNINVDSEVNRRIAQMQVEARSPTPISSTTMSARRQAFRGKISARNW